MVARKPKISIISPCYRELENVTLCHESVKALFDGPLSAYEREHIFADDFSDARTLVILNEIAQRDPSVKVIYNARNYGVYRTTFNALRHATGDAIVPMLPVDLQDPPEFIPEMVKIWESGKPVVYGMRFQRDESWFMMQIRRLYYIILHGTAEIKIPKYAGEFQVIDRWVLDAMLKHDDYYPFIRGMIANVCGDNYGVHYVWARRKIGKTKHNFAKLYDHGVNGLISFSVWPLRIIVLLGMIVSVCSVLFALFQILVTILGLGHHQAPPGVSTAITGLFFLCGVILFFLGIIGEYVGAIHSQVRRGPSVVERSFEDIEKSLKI